MSSSSRRSLNRSLDRPCRRRSLTHWLVPARARPDYLGQALTAFRRSIRAHRLLIRLAPDQFDPTSVERLARDKAVRERHWQEFVCAVTRVYGQKPDFQPNWDPMPLKPAVASRVEAALVEWEEWLQLGRVLFDRHQRLRRHAWQSLARIANLFDVASQLGRLSCGMDPLSQAIRPPEEIPDRWEHDLARAYGRSSSDSS